MHEDQLADLRRRSAVLDPLPRQRAELVEAATGHALRFLAAVDEHPTFTAGGPRPAGLRIPEQAQDLDDVLKLLAEHVDLPGVGLTSARYLGYIPAGGLLPAAIGDFLAAVSNRYAGLPAISPGAAAVEATVVRWLADVVGLGAAAGGTLTSGGSIATLTAVHAAREASSFGPADTPRVCVYVTDQTHHCLDKALRVCGLGQVQVRRVQLDHLWRMDVPALARAVDDDRAAGLLPWLVVATAGSTGVGAVDPLEAIAELCDATGVWLHVDGAYGGLFALCPEVSGRLAGLHRADTVVVDPHKTLFLPYGTGAVLARDRSLLQHALGAGADYLPDPRAEVAAADLSLELTRPFRGLGLWLALQLGGTEAFTAALTEKVHLARHLHGLFATTAGFEVGPAPDLSLFSYRALPTAGDPDAFNLELAARVQAGGETFISPTRAGGRVLLRAAVLSFRTHREHVEQAYRVIVREARRLRDE